MRFSILLPALAAYLLPSVAALAVRANTPPAVWLSVPNNRWNQACLPPKMTFKDAKLGCFELDDGQLFDAWSRLEVPAYLETWFEGFEDKNKVFGKDNFPHFPDTFAKTHKTNFHGDGCDWGECTVKECEVADADGLDPRAWLVMVAIGNTREKLHDYMDMLTATTLQEYLKSTDSIVKDVIKNVHEPPPSAALLSILTMVGAALAGAAAFGGAVAGPLSVLPATLLVYGASGGVEKAYQPPWTQEDVVTSVMTALGSALEVYGESALKSFTEIVMMGNAPRPPIGNSVSNKIVFSNKLETATGNAIARYLGTKEFWIKNTASEESKNRLEITLRRVALSAALTTSRHFVLKNDMPKKTKGDWMENCNKLAGGWADIEGKACWSLQGMRTDGSFPVADIAAIGGAFKKSDNTFDIVLSDFYKSIEACHQSCSNPPFCGQRQPDSSYSNWATSLMSSALENESMIGTCTFNIPFLNRDSVCSEDRDDKFPWYSDNCNVKVSRLEFNHMVPGTYNIGKVIGKVYGGEVECGSESKFDNLYFPDSTVACSN